jgi:hypothetical protein
MPFCARGLEGVVAKREQSLRESFLPSRGFRACPCLKHVAGELRSGPDPELAENLAQVIVHRARADEQLGGDLLVRGTLRDKTRDLRLLRRQVAACLGGPFACAFPGRLELDPGAFGVRGYAELAEQLVGAAQLLARVESPAFASQPFAVEQTDAGELHANACTLERRDGLTVEALGGLPVGQ